MRTALALVVFVVALLTARAATAQLLSPGPLSKGHAALEGDQHCNDCHSSGKRVDQGACLKCHSDLGARIAAGQGLHGRQYRGQACEGCHVEHHGAGAALVRWPGGDPAKLDHSQTGWPLKNAHAPLTCNKCHARTNARPRTSASRAHAPRATRIHTTTASARAARAATTTRRGRTYGSRASTTIKRASPFAARTKT